MKEIVGESVNLVESIPNLMPPTGSSADDVGAWSKFAERSSDLFGENTDTIRFLTGNDTGYDKAKRNSMVELFLVLQNSKAFQKLCDIVPTAGSSDEAAQGIRLIELLKGQKTAEKKRLLNAALVVYSLNHCRDGFEAGDPQGYYQPNTMQTKLKHIFRLLKESGISYEQRDFKSYPSAYKAVFKTIFDEAQRIRPEYGRKPFQASVEFNDDWKIRSMADPVFRPWDVPRDALLLAFYFTNRDIQFRNREVRVVDC